MAPKDLRQKTTRILYVATRIFSTALINHSIKNMYSTVYLKLYTACYQSHYGTTKMKGLETVSLLKQLQVRCFKEKVCVCVRERKLRHQHRGACVICEPVFGIASNSWQPICPVIVPWEKKSHMTSRRKNSSLHPSKSLLGLLEILQSLRSTIGMTRSRRRQG